MDRRLPPLKSLQAFEAVCRHGSYTAAARVLNVQQPAISYQIRKLESDLDTLLFRRGREGSQRTADGEALFVAVSRGFAEIEAAVTQIRGRPERAVTTIATYPGLATFWLTPRLGELTERLETTPRVVTMLNEVDLLREDASCWIVFGRGDWPAHDSRRLMPEEVFPVAAPQVAREITAADGRLPPGVTIVEQEDKERRWLGWDDWQTASGTGAPLVGRRVTVTDHGLALHMAVSGRGVALAWSGVVGELLDAGALERLSPDHLRSDAGYWLLGRPGFFETAIGRTVLSVLDPEITDAVPTV